MKGRVEALLIKPGPTQSGPVPRPPPQPAPVGGEVLQVDKMSLILSQELLIILLIAIPVTFFLFYKRPGILLKLLSFLKF
ncbi:MAG: hypothetical protein LUQ46_01360 [Candidatus Methanomethyliaceae archaeon]|nr:hypothetical protein [Candidatus Methanomethyliaceae archaeon]